MCDVAKKLEIYKQVLLIFGSKRLDYINIHTFIKRDKSMQ